MNRHASAHCKRSITRMVCILNTCKCRDCRTHRGDHVAFYSSFYSSCSSCSSCSSHPHNRTDKVIECVCRQAFIGADRGEACVRPDSRPALLCSRPCRLCRRPRRLYSRLCSRACCPSRAMQCRWRRPGRRPRFTHVLVDCGCGEATQSQCQGRQRQQPAHARASREFEHVRVWTRVAHANSHK